MKNLNQKIHMPLGNNIKDFELDAPSQEVLTSFFELLICVDKEEIKKLGKIC